MDYSEKKDLAKAVSQLQGELPTVEKNATGYGYKYATLDECMSKLKPLLAKYELALFQPLEYDEQGRLFCRTILLHSSGQSIDSVCPCQINQGDKMSTMQRIGTAITYARRYSLSLIGLTTDEDTDDNQEKHPVNKPNNKHENKSLNKQNNNQQNKPIQEKTLGQKQFGYLFYYCINTLKVDKNDVMNLLRNTEYIKDKDYTKEEISNFMNELKIIVEG